MFNYKDAYSEEIIENQALLFERASLKGYNMEDFITAYMSSQLRYKIDTRQAYYCNMLSFELLEEFEKEFHLPIGSVSFDFMLANWVGEFYAKIQDILNIPSYMVIKKYPAKMILKKCNGLHDYDMSLVIKKVLGNISK